MEAAALLFQSQVTKIGAVRAGVGVIESAALDGSAQQTHLVWMPRKPLTPEQRARRQERERARPKKPRQFTPEQRARRTEREKRWRAANKERIREQANARYAANPERGRASSRRWAKVNPEKSREAYRKTRLKCKYGLTLEQWQALFDTQGRCCGICKSTNPRNRRYGWSTDHDHGTNAVRGILCNVCNTLLGRMGDTHEAIMEKTRLLLQYLKVPQ